MSDKPREARTIHRFIAGLQLLGDAVVAAGPRDFVGNHTEFTLDRELDQSELAALKALGFLDYQPAIRTLPTTICFAEWSDS